MQVIQKCVTGQTKKDLVFIYRNTAKTPVGLITMLIHKMIAITNRAVNVQKPLVLENQDHSFLFGKEIGTIMQ